MGTDNSTNQAGDTKPNSQITNTGRQASLPTKYLDAKDVDSEEDKSDTKVDLNNADTRRTLETQGSNLPKLTQVMITNVPRRLKHNSKNLEQWVLRVKFALAQLRLEHLINSSVSRPAKGRHNYNRWVQWSRTVANWLYLQVDGNIQEGLQQRRKICSKADALFDEIMKMVGESDNAVNSSAKVNNYDNQKTSDFEAVRQYIAAHQSHYHLLGGLLINTNVFGDFHGIFQLLQLHLVTGPAAPITLFSPYWVYRLPPEQLERMIGEEISGWRKRQRLQNQVEDLEMGRKIILQCAPWSFLSFFNHSSCFSICNTQCREIYHTHLVYDHDGLLRP
ncbi:unnamed protein product [Penicillium nalgiovense]|uniref:Uncharacterized protein n=1 Tax=Penicillium nalgiovense TaxID=60175 RepID=A0A9W4N6J9_PENNA|nr:unnamed protein product [Penicillium nalgiovense]CAG7994915.1 unnamed protein product [Penicillium nalgiovense]CAG8017416.1 unnamed protein product [Penicillium nalgiovense]CAG8047529.1 unnamed protein product [Penicillium nalgiovense]CAG8061130.1 unnamed protein product [Penicillium nalgiovense]